VLFFFSVFFFAKKTKTKRGGGGGGGWRGGGGGGGGGGHRGHLGHDPFLSCKFLSQQGKLERFFPLLYIRTDGGHWQILLPLLSPGQALCKESFLCASQQELHDLSSPLSSGQASACSFPYCLSRQGTCLSCPLLHLQGRHLNDSFRLLYFRQAGACMILVLCCIFGSASAYLFTLMYLSAGKWHDLFLAVNLQAASA